jgi:hypothetical protein
MGSWIQLFRSFFTDEMWRERRRYSRAEAWIDILGMRAYGTMDVMMGRCQNSIAKGECAVSRSYLATRWGWSEKEVRTYLGYLVKRDLIEVRNGRNATIIKVLRVDTENSKNQPNGQPKGQPNSEDYQVIMDMEGQPNGQPKGQQEIEDNIYNIISLSTAHAYSNNINISNTREGIDGEVDMMMESRLWRETTCMMFKISDDELSGYLEEFRLHCKVGGMESHMDGNDARCHFRDWLRKRKEKGNGTGDRQRSSAEYIADAERRAIELSEQFVREAKKRRGEIQEGTA